jgi:hypothetical protein
MFPKVLKSSGTEEPDREAPIAGADDRPDSPDVEPRNGSVNGPAEGAAPLDQNNGSALPDRQSYLETLYPDDWGSRFECMGELVVERKADPSDVVEVYNTLNETLDADILYVNPTLKGISIVCGIKDLGTFISSLPKMPRLASWALTHR